jgi:hypothetical protein
MSAARHAAAGLLVLALVPGTARAQLSLSGGQRAITPPESLYQQLVAQARTRFAQAGVEPSTISWRLLDDAIRQGVSRLGPTAAAADMVSLTRRSLNAFVDDMIHAASYENGGLVAHETTFIEAMRRCKPARYPICP